ncbi:prolyl oligopeptidase family serine peptidase [Chryseobacterium sp.]|uniref:prolyl oligopeptidase family serine peptidase n=1 Tax=Chryseobacterium sp. TaxID=1871047 RepID=UPI0011C7D028|nr:prolyl oligopeptidase family serine peptidase [Chryseobacterium sp.]TXF79465.1 prolyl oligopeptidase family serine peptidase [Chryseobacterium sp.]
MSLFEKRSESIAANGKPASHHSPNSQSSKIHVDWQDTRTFYNALKRNDKKVIALFYKNNGHGMTDDKAQADLSRRLHDWLDYFLKDIPVEWIGVEMKKDA